MEIKRKFHLQRKSDITGLACFANSNNPKADRKDEVGLTRLLLNQDGVNCETSTLQLVSEPKIVYSLHFPDTLIKVIEQPEHENFVVLLEGTNEKFIEKVYDHFLQKNMPKETIYTKVDGKLLKIEPDEDAEGYVVFETIQTMHDSFYRAFKFLKNSQMQDVLKCTRLEKHGDYTLMKCDHPSSLSNLLL